jgi:hypothetical protein
MTKTIIITSNKRDGYLLNVLNFTALMEIKQFFLPLQARVRAVGEVIQLTGRWSGVDEL